MKVKRGTALPAMALALTCSPLFYRETACTVEEGGGLRWLMEKGPDPSGGHMSDMLQLTLVSLNPGYEEFKQAIQPLTDYLHDRQQEVRERLQEYRQRPQPPQEPSEHQPSPPPTLLPPASCPVILLQRCGQGSRRDVCEVRRGVVRSYREDVDMFQVREGTCY